MKTVKYFIVALILIVVLLAGLSSCATATNTLEESDQVAGYTLKNKTELLQQKILNRNCKTIIAIP